MYTRSPYLIYCVGWCIRTTMWRWNHQFVRCGHVREWNMGSPSSIENYIEYFSRILEYIASLFSCSDYLERTFSCALRPGRNVVRFGNCNIVWSTLDNLNLGPIEEVFVGLVNNCWFTIFEPISRPIISNGWLFVGRFDDWIGLSLNFGRSLTFELAYNENKALSKRRILLKLYSV